MRHQAERDAAPSAAPCLRPSRRPEQPGCVIRGEHAGDCVGYGSGAKGIVGAGRECVGCAPRPAERGSPLCRKCQRELTYGIAEMPGLALELVRGVAPAGAVPRVGSGGGKVAGSPDFARGRGALELVAQMAHDSAWLAREVAGVRGIGHPVFDAVKAPLRAVQSACTWLTVHTGWMVGRPQAPDWLGAVMETRRECLQLIDSAARQRFRLPDGCPDCGGELWATTFEVGDTRENRVWCRGEDTHEWAAEQWLRLGRRLGYGSRAEMA